MSVTKETTALAYAIAAHATECIGPNGKVMCLPAEDAPMVRAAFIARLAEAATKIANEEQP